MEYGKYESHALCIIGAGFSLANSRPYLPSTANLIPETVNWSVESLHNRLKSLIFLVLGRFLTN